MADCFKFDVHLIDRALALAEFKAGNSMLARIAIIAITTNNSISVNMGFRHWNSFMIILLRGLVYMLDAFALNYSRFDT